MRLINRFNTISNRWELGYYTDTRFIIMSTYPAVR